MNLLNESLDDGLVVQLLTERGHGGSGTTASHQEVGERAIASKTRISGTKDLADAIHDVMAALRAAGWSGDTRGASAAILDADHTDGADGREYALRNAISDAEVYADGAGDVAAATNSFPEMSYPPGSVEFFSCQGGGGALIRYISAGQADPGPDEVRATLAAAGVGVVAVRRNRLD